MNPRIQGFLSTNRLAASNIVDSLIASSMRAAYALAAAKSKLPSEPDFIALLVTQAAPQFAAALGGTLKSVGVQMRVTSVFCHGRPEVQHAAGRCEIGDLLLALFHTDSNGTTARTSLLLQAKMTNSPLHTVGTADLIQLSLYTRWGPFTYTRASGLSGQVRSVTPAQSHSGAQYLLIDSNGPNDPTSGVSGLPHTYPMGTALSQRNLVLHHSLGTALVDAMLGNEGRCFCEEPLAKSDWDQVIWDLLRHSLRTTFSRRAVGISRHGRGVDSTLPPAIMTAGDPMHGSQIDQILSTEGHFRGGSPEHSTDNDDTGGVSLILIETSEPR